jgi:hypothetical protein
MFVAVAVAVAVAVRGERVSTALWASQEQRRCAKQKEDGESLSSIVWSTQPPETAELTEIGDS